MGGREGEQREKSLGQGGRRGARLLDWLISHEKKGPTHNWGRRGRGGP